MAILGKYVPSLLISYATFTVVYLVFPSLRLFADRIMYKSPRLARLLIRLASPQIADRAFLVIALVALIGIPAQSVHSYEAFRSFPDMSFFDRIVSSLLQSGSSNLILSFLGRRFNPIMFALVPLYVLWSDPRALLILQSIGFVLAIFPLYWLARQRVGRLLALTVVVAYLVSPAVQVLNLASFAEIKLAVPLFSFGTLFLLRRRYIPFLICLGIALLLKTEVAFIAVGFALFIVFVQRNRFLGLGIAAVGGALGLFIIQFLFPSLYQSQYSVFSERYAYLGNTLGEIITSLFLRPDVVFQHFWVVPKIDFVANLFTPLALLPWVGIEVLFISLPSWLYTLLSDFPQQFDTTQYYQAPLLPFLFFGTVIGLERILKWRKTSREDSPRLKLALCALLVVSSQLYLSSAWMRIFDPNNFSTNPHDVLGHELLKLIPKNTTVIAQTEFYVPLVADRNYNVLEFSPNGDYREADYIVGDSSRFWYAFHQDAWEQWRASGYFESVKEQDSYFLLKRKTLIDASRQIDNGGALLGFTDRPNPFNHPLGLEFGKDLTLVGYAAVPSESVRGGEEFHVFVEWRARQDIQTQYIILARLIDSRGNVWAQDDRQPIIPTSQWKDGVIVRDQYVFTLARTMPPGIYQLSLAVWDPAAEKRLIVADSQGQSMGMEVGIGAVQVEKDSSSVEASYLEIENPVYVDMREIRLLGSKPIPERLVPGDELQLGLYWRARQKPLGDYSVTVQLRDANGGVVLEQTDRPAAGAYPTTQWRVGEILLDWHDLTLPFGLSPGKYTVAVILQDMSAQREIGEAEIGEIDIGIR